MPNYTLQAMCWGLRRFLFTIFISQLNFRAMAIGFMNATTSGNGDVGYYLREKECTRFVHSSGDLSRSEVLKSWRTIEENEKLGNKELGIRGRHDAQVRKNYVLTMPNVLNDKECTDRVKRIIEKTPIKNCTWTICVHKGEKDGITNKHVHLLVNERNLQSMKKDREMIKKAFLVKELRPTYEQEFKHEFGQSKNLNRRERIKVPLYEADRKIARDTVKEFEKVAHKEVENQQSVFLKQLMGVGQLMKDREEQRLEEQRQKEQQAAELKKEQLAQQQREKEQQLKKEQLQQKQRGWGMSPGR